MRYLCRGILPDDFAPSDVHVEDGTVQRVCPAGHAKADFGGADARIGPTLCDIQVNGVRGIDLQSGAVTAENIADATQALAAWGVSCWVPTLVTGAPDAMAQACRAIAEARRDKTLARAVPGLHLEGPHISPEDGPRGAHPEPFVCKPCLRLFDRLQRAADGAVLYTTVAPEWPNAPRYIEGLRARGVQAALGHHNASEAAIARAVEAGARLCTHLGNGLASQIHRHVNPLWPQLADDRLHASLIADLHHLPPPMLKTFIRAKGPSRVVLTSDCVHVALLPPGAYSLAGAPVELTSAGRVCLSGTDLLAGSALMLLQGVVNAVYAGGMTYKQALASATRIPAELLGIKRPFDPPRPGNKADFIVFDELPETPCPQAAVRAVFIAGQLAAPT